MTIKELAVLYALNSLEIIGHEIGPMERGHVPASTVTRYIRDGSKVPGQTRPGLVGPLAGLDPKWKPSKREVVCILAQLRGRSHDVLKERRVRDSMVSVIERPGKANLYCLAQPGVGVLCL